MNPSEPTTDPNPTHQLPSSTASNQSAPAGQSAGTRRNSLLASLVGAGTRYLLSKLPPAPPSPTAPVMQAAPTHSDSAVAEAPTPVVPAEVAANLTEDETKLQVTAGDAPNPSPAAVGLVTDLDTENPPGISAADHDLSESLPAARTETTTTDAAVSALPQAAESLHQTESSPGHPPLETDRETTDPSLWLRPEGFSRSFREIESEVLVAESEDAGDLPSANLEVPATEHELISENAASFISETFVEPVSSSPSQEEPIITPNIALLLQSSPFAAPLEPLATAPPFVGAASPIAENEAAAAARVMNSAEAFPNSEHFGIESTSGENLAEADPSQAPLLEADRPDSFLLHPGPSADATPAIGVTSSELPEVVPPSSVTADSGAPSTFAEAIPMLDLDEVLQASSTELLSTSSSSSWGDLMVPFPEPEPQSAVKAVELPSFLAPLELPAAELPPITLPESAEPAGPVFAERLMNQPSAPAETSFAPMWAEEPADSDSDPAPGGIEGIFARQLDLPEVHPTGNVTAFEPPPALLPVVPAEIPSQDIPSSFVCWPAESAADAPAEITTPAPVAEPDPFVLIPGAEESASLPQPQPAPVVSTHFPGLSSLAALISPAPAQPLPEPEPISHPFLVSPQEMESPRYPAAQNPKFAAEDLANPFAEFLAKAPIPESASLPPEAPPDWPVEPPAQILPPQQLEEVSSPSESFLVIPEAPTPSPASMTPEEIWRLAAEEEPAPTLEEQAYAPPPAHDEDVTSPAHLLPQAGPTFASEAEKIFSSAAEVEESTPVAAPSTGAPGNVKHTLPPWIISAPARPASAPGAPLTAGPIFLDLPKSGAPPVTLLPPAPDTSTSAVEPEQKAPIFFRPASPNVIKLSVSAGPPATGAPPSAANLDLTDDTQRVPIPEDDPRRKSGQPTFGAPTPPTVTMVPLIRTKVKERRRPVGAIAALLLLTGAAAAGFIYREPLMAWARQFTAGSSSETQTLPPPLPSGPRRIPISVVPSPTPAPAQPNADPPGGQPAVPPAAEETPAPQQPAASNPESSAPSNPQPPTPAPGVPPTPEAAPAPPPLPSLTEPPSAQPSATSTPSDPSPPAPGSQPPVPLSPSPGTPAKVEVRAASELPDLPREEASDAPEPPPANQEEAEQRKARDVIKSLLRAGSVDQVIDLIHEKDRVGDLARAYYGDKPLAPVPFDSVVFDSGARVPDTNGHAYLFRVRSPDRTHGFPISAEETPAGYKIDWEAYVQCKDRLTRSFWKNSDQAPASLYVILKRGHYFGDDIPNSDSLYCFKINSPNPDEEPNYAFLGKGTELARDLDRRLQWDATYFVIADFAQVKHSGGSHVELRKINRWSWRGKRDAK